MATKINHRMKLPADVDYTNHVASVLGPTRWQRFIRSILSELGPLLLVMAVLLALALGVCR